MKSLFVISPHYLTAVSDIVEDYSFNLQGYRDINLALDALPLLNIKNTIGFVYIANELPEYRLVLEFINKLELMGGTKPLILVSKDVNDFNGFLELFNKKLRKKTKTKIKYRLGFTIMSDVLIRKCIGEILKSTESPYLHKKVESQVNTKKEYNNIESLFEKDETIIFNKVYKLDNLERTLYNDYPLSKMEDIRYIKLREKLIYAHFGLDYELDDIELEGHLILLNKKINYMIDDIRKEEN